MIPVQLEVKEYTDKAFTPKLYILVTLGSKKAGVKNTNPFLKGRVSASNPALTVNLSDIVASVNPSDGDFLMYVPDQMRNDEQVQAKRRSIDDRCE